MVFSSAVFLFIFLPLTLIGNALLPRLWMRNFFLLLMSLLFYAWGEQFFVLVMLASIVLNYVFGLLVDHYQSRRQAARRVLALAVAVNLGLLIAYKYANFFVDSLNVLLLHLDQRTIPLERVHLPIGISFFTFHALSYLIDIYRGDARAQRNPFNMGLYISLFPQLIAGPILRYKDVGPQIDARSQSLDLFATGIRRFAIGLGKKMILANTFAGVADRVFGLAPADLTTSVAWLGATAYALQIYFDFSGYSDMAIGLGRMFGFHFRENFNYPYVSTSVREFWKRWHISLSTWFRDYLYIPLGGNRKSHARTGFNLMLVFFLCGLWHGASWTFVIWGLFHGFFLLLERTAWGRMLDRLSRPLQILYTLLAVQAGWVFFRADTLRHALAMLGAMSGFAQGDGIRLNCRMLCTTEYLVTLGLGVIAATPVWPALASAWQRFARRQGSRLEWLAQAGHAVIDLICVPVVLVYAAMLLARGTYNPFIYFRF